VITVAQSALLSAAAVLLGVPVVIGIFGFLRLTGKDRR
jgi:hypothetical protein